MAMLFYVALIVVIASALQGFTGFGYGLALMATLPFFLSIKNATVVVSFSIAFISLFMVWRNRKNIERKIILYPLIGFLLFVPVGIKLLNYFQDDVLKIFLGFLLVINSVFFFIKGGREYRFKTSVFNGLLVGAIGGTLGGMLTIGGPPLVLYFVHAAKDKYTYKASLDTIFLISSIYRLAWLYMNGTLTPEMGPILITAVVAGILGTVIGFNLLIQVDRAVLTKTVYVIMSLAGLSLIIM